jgi:hypothetical protein
MKNLDKAYWTLSMGREVIAVRNKCKINKEKINKVCNHR